MPRIRSEPFSVVGLHVGLLCERRASAGDVCVAAPVGSHDSENLGAVSVAGPTNRFRGDRFREELPQTVLEVPTVVELDNACSRRRRSEQVNESTVLCQHDGWPKFRQVWPGQ
ncbi:IclR family transcriptional regulator C-terminal domain-containing protein [Haloarcula sp. 1CSR25-25]|uniref:IclR family transcriptional regulator domain-containing protein n=1 Tax=Haloarcula sp. 1CSR25-25 TaxID=2862545 RepID=UPI002893C4C7|nr:IclR family transcriptional regulator C-terminal domain-containing protein [Haloarcula sp. 1CSR25-25]MDT3436490.1 IclR family transcriptional regulator C-terminal domain-containing protein [Haloarcula sp. 1CSR25-25]